MISPDEWPNIDPLNFFHLGNFKAKVFGEGGGGEVYRRKFCCVCSHSETKLRGVSLLSSGMKGGGGI